MHRTPAAYAMALVVVLCPGASARAAPSPVALRIACGTLDEDARAALEARAQAELASERLPEGEVEVVCDATSATLSWTPKEGVRQERHVSLGLDSGADAILAALHVLLVEEKRPLEEVRPPPSTDAGVRNADALPARPPIAPLPEPLVGEAARTPLEARRVHVAGIVGGDVELWQGGLNVALGASTGLAVSPWARWTLRLLVAPQWGVGSALGISAWGLRAVADIDYALLPRFELGIGAGARSLWASAPRAASTQLEGTSAGAIASLRYGFALGPITLSLGVKGEVLARPIIVEYSGSEAFRLPSFVAGATFDGAAP